MKVNKMVLILVFFLAISMSITLAIGISPAKTTINYEPGKIAAVKLRIINNQHEDGNFAIYAAGNLSSLIKLDESMIHLSAQDNERIVNAQVSLPAGLSEGNHNLEFVVLQLPKSVGAAESIEVQGNVVIVKTGSSEAMISSTASVISKLQIQVPYKGAYLEANLYISDCVENGTASLSIPLYNLGTAGVDVQADIVIKDPFGKTAGQLQTKTVTVQPAQEGRLTADWNANVKGGEYYAFVTIHYAGKKLELNKAFRVGEMLVSIQEIDTGNFYLGQIAKFNIFLKNNWNLQIKDLYGEVRIHNTDGSELTKFKTASIDIDPGVISPITAYWDTAGINVGAYDMNIILHYSGKTTTQMTRINVNLDSIQTESFMTAAVIAEQGKFRSQSIMLVVLIALILASIATIVTVKYRKKRPPQNNYSNINEAKV
ncbi:MAG: hypothetical protein V1837_01170 [Candidatus Woesearchaeota archaeon]